MKIFESVRGNKKDGVVIILDIKEAVIIQKAMEDYCDNHKRLKNAKKIELQMYHELPVG